MSYYINNYTNINTYQGANRGYINKHEKSLKLPFFSAMQNSMLNTKPAPVEESIPEVTVDNANSRVALSSAVIGASPPSDTDTGDATYG